jgi:hypothetical protein
MDLISTALEAVRWQYADQDLAAIQTLTERIRLTGRKFGLISYTDLVDGVEFRYSSINNGAPHHINVWGEWTGLDRRIIGDCLGYISKSSYLEAGFMASALVIARQESKPSDIFFEWMKDLGVLANLREDTVLAFWSDQVKRAHHWYRYGKQLTSTN